MFAFEVSNASYDTLLGAYIGNNLSKLVEIVGNDNYGTRRTSRISFPALEGSNYLVVVAGKNIYDLTQAGSFALSWYPTPPPGFTGTQFSPASGPPGTKVTLTGTNFTGATSVFFNGASASFTNALTNNLDLRITAIVPLDATSSSITMVTPHGNVTSTASFQVLPPSLTVRLTSAYELEITWPATSTEFV